MQQPLPLQLNKVKISYLIKVEHMKPQYDLTKNLATKYSYKQNLINLADLGYIVP